jgi:hypothetical protein
VVINRVENDCCQPIGMVGELQGGASRLSALLNASNRSQRMNQWRLVWVAVFAVLLTACSGMPSQSSATSSTASPLTLSRTSSNPAQVQPTPHQGSVSRSTTEIVPDVLGLTLAAARSALYAADVGKYSWLYGCHGSPKILVDANTGRRASLELVCRSLRR